MKVVVLGGYGVFGSLLAEMLIRDGHQVWLGGRSAAKAQACAERLGARPLVVDLRREPERIFSVRPQVVVDAAGPFQLYRDDPYLVPRLCIREGVDYLDLSDDATFTLGIATLDAQARQAGCWVLSGASSVPGLSSAVVTELAPGLDEILLVDTAILPGNRAPRGTSVIAGILGQVGRTAPVWRGGAWRQVRCWSGRRRYDLGRGVQRSGYLIEVPDLRLFPQAFGARSVLFRAGMELAVLNAGLAGLALIRRFWKLPITPAGVRLVQWLASLLLPFGTDRGGMRVAVTGLRDGAPVEREWRLIAEAGQGPYVPGIVARALLRRGARIPPGARPCLGEVTLREIDEAASDLAISTERIETSRPTLFQRALGDRWSSLPPGIRALHGVQDMESFSGVAQVTRGTSLVARLAAGLFGFPQAGENVPVRVTKTRVEGGELWERNFAGSVFRSRCLPAMSPARVRERFWPFCFELELLVENGSMQLPVRRGWLLGVPMPRAILPSSDSREQVMGGAFHFDIKLGAPLGGGLIVHYRGHLRPDRDDEAARMAPRT